MELLAEIRRSRRCLPASHRALLEQLNVQEAVLHVWPDGVIDIYRTLNERPPKRNRLDGAAAVWLQAHRTVAFNAPLLEAAVAGLNEPSARATIESVAWHEYGHALSLMLSTDDHRAAGPSLLRLLPDGLRRAVGADGYPRAEVFDEIVATLYPLLVGRIRDHGYGPPDFLHPSLYAAFQEVIPWPPTH
jgi:hypothetical protein